MRRIGSIQGIEVTSTVPGEDPRLVILFHGFGADAYDLQTLSDALAPKVPTDFFFPQGPLEVPIGPGWTGRAWWKIELAGLSERDMPNEYPAGLKQIRPKVLEMVAQCGVPWSKVVVGGFSQGAMLATDLYLHAPELPAGLIILSGALICQDEWRPLAEARKGAKFFQSHGKNDVVLPFKGAQRLETLLTQAGMVGKLEAFGGGHEIPMGILTKAAEYLRILFQ